MRGFWFSIKSKTQSPLYHRVYSTYELRNEVTSRSCLMLMTRFGSSLMNARWYRIASHASSNFRSDMLLRGQLRVKIANQSTSIRVTFVASCLSDGTLSHHPKSFIRLCLLSKYLSRSRNEEFVVSAVVSQLLFLYIYLIWNTFYF